MKPTGKDLAKIAVFTTHALEQFEKRFHMVDPTACFHGEKTARKILAHAREDRSLDSVARVRRLIDNNAQPALYYMNSSYRFVIVEKRGKFIVKTVELPI